MPAPLFGATIEVMPKPATTAALTSLLATAALTVLTGCGGYGSNAEVTDTRTTSTGSVSPTVDPSLAAEVPERIAAKGTLTVGTDPSLPPAEFTKAGEKQPTGLDVDLVEAVADELGLDVTWKATSLSDVVPGVADGTYDLGVSALTITRDRMEKVSMVSYFEAPTRWAKADRDGTEVDPQKPCGLTVAVKKDVVQARTDLPTKVKECAAVGSPLTVRTYPKQQQVTDAVLSGDADAMLADAPVVSAEISRTQGRLVAVGASYDPVEWGVAVPRDEPKLAEAVSRAFEELHRSGDYRRILKKWGNVQGRASDFTVNP